MFGGSTLVAIGLVLVVEQLPRGHAHDAGLDPFGLEGLVGLDAERNLAAGGEQEDVGLAPLGIGEDVGALGQARGGGVLGAVERGEVLAGQDQGDRARGAAS